MEKTTRLNIDGMTCINCQNKIERALIQTEGVIRADVSYSAAVSDIVYDDEKITLAEIIKVVEQLEYSVVLEHQAATHNLINIICLLTIIVSLYIMLQSTGILNLLVPSQLADTKIGYGMLFVIGLLTSVHCIAMCGGINLTQCIPQPVKNELPETGKTVQLPPALTYNMGRVLSYTMIGFSLGLVSFWLGGGSAVGMTIPVQGILKMIAGLFMVIMGINMLGLFPWFRNITICMPVFLFRKINAQKLKTNRPFIVGILNGFLPCGPLQSMWIVAFSTGNPFAGALSMFLFSLGTVPLMLGLGSFVSVLGKKFTDKVMTVGAILVIVLGLAMLSQGGLLSGWFSSDLLLVFMIALCIVGVLMSIPITQKKLKYVINALSILIVIGACLLWDFHSDTETDANIKLVDGVQIVDSTLSSGSYPSITVFADIPVKWSIEAPEGSINGCNNKLVIQDYGIEYTFHTGQNIIEFTPNKTGTIPYSCWMGMIRGNILVKDPP